MSKIATSQSHPTYSWQRFAQCNLAILFLRLLWLCFNPLELYADEAQYWLWSLEPELGYYSKPPMIAWVIWLTSHFGNNEMWVRSASPILYSLSACGVYGISRRLSPRGSVAFWAALAYLTLPAVAVGAMLMTTDALLLLFWALCLYCMVQALQPTTERKAIFWWCAAGLAAGFGMLSKPNMLLFLPIAIWWLWRYVPKFYTKIPWTIGTALIVYSPNVYWNLTHQMATVHHVTELVLGDYGSKILINSILFFLAQFGVIGPVLFGLTICLLVRHWRTIINDRILSLLWGFTLTPLAVVLLCGVFSKAYANWAAPSCITLCIALAYTIQYCSSPSLQRWFYYGILVNITLSILIMLAPFLPSQHPVLAKYNLLQRLQGGKALGDNVCAIYQQYQSSTTRPVIIASDDRKELVLTGYYCLRHLTQAGKPFPLVKWNPMHQLHDHFDLSTNLNQYKNADILLISKSLTLATLHTYMPTATINNSFSITYNGHQRLYNIFLIQDFQGY